jgi:hypothetical protein
MVTGDSEEVLNKNLLLEVHCVKAPQMVAICLTQYDQPTCSTRELLG